VNESIEARSSNNETNELELVEPLPNSVIPTQAREISQNTIEERDRSEQDLKLKIHISISNKNEIKMEINKLEAGRIEKLETHKSK
jgi:hypothetical protein